MRWSGWRQRGGRMEAAWRLLDARAGGQAAVDGEIAEWSEPVVVVMCVLHRFLLHMHVRVAVCVPAHRMVDDAVAQGAYPTRALCLPGTHLILRDSHWFCEEVG